MTPAKPQSATADKPREIGKDLVCDIGEYFVCQVLSQWGINAVLTRHNAEKVDVIAYCKDTLRSTTVQVKAYHGTGQTTVCNKTKGYCQNNDPIFRGQAKFWILISLDKTQHQVRCVHVWDSEDRDFLTEGWRKNQEVWRVDPYGKKHKEQWEARKGDGGWRRLVEFLKTPAPAGD